MKKNIYLFIILLNPLLSFGASNSQDYLSDLEQTIKQDMKDTSSSISSASDKSVKFTEVGKDKSSVVEEPRGTLIQYFTTISEKKHPLVDFYVKYYSTFGKKSIEESLSRIQKYFPIIVDIAKQNKLPLEVLLIPMIENNASLSGIKNDRAGLWMLSKSTAQIYGLNLTDYNDERLDIIKSTQAALSYFSSLKEAFNDDWDLALTAFNGGGAYFQQEMRTLGVDNFWDLLDHPSNNVSSDALEYVPKFYALLTILKHPNQYRVNIPIMDADNIKFTKITIAKSGVSFKDIAKLTNMSTVDLTSLNPHLSRQYTVKGATLYVPSNTGYLAVSRIRVAKAITLRKIPSGNNTAITNIGPKASGKSYKNVTVAKKSTVRYKVRKKDTLYSVAKRYNVSVDSLKRQNKIQGSSLKVGQVLNIAKNTTVSRKVAKQINYTKKANSKVNYYVVKPGDTIYSIAKNYHVSMDKVLNHKNGNIKPGDNLIIVK